MKAKLFIFAFLVFFAVPAAAQTDKLGKAMEADNARWLAAFNTPNPAAFPAMYTQGAILLPPASNQSPGLKP